MNCLTITASILLMIGMVYGFPNGAPNTCCEEMVPGHPGTTAQPGTSPNFSTVPNKREIAANETVRLTISSNDRNAAFKGYLVVANEAGRDNIVGIFRLPSDGKVINCQLANSYVLNSAAATHMNNSLKSSVTVDWNPNGFTGNVTFKTSYVHNTTTFWVKGESVTVTVLPSADSTVSPATSPATNPSIVTSPSTISTTSAAGGVQPISTLIGALCCTLFALVLSI